MVDVSDNLGFGCVELTNFTYEHDAMKMLEAVYAGGIKYFDTAPSYSNGFSEKILGSFIKRVDREKVTIATKFSGRVCLSSKLPSWAALPLNAVRKKLLAKPAQAAAQPRLPGELVFKEVTLPAIKQELQESLDRLCTNYIDNYMLHEAVPSFLTEDALAYLLEQKKKGIIRTLGVASNYSYVERCHSLYLQYWDILQYENGPGHDTDYLLRMYPDKKHIYHSALRFQKLLIDKELSNREKPGYILAQAITKNPKGLTLFSTTKIAHLQENLSQTHKFLRQFQAGANGFHKY